MTALDEHLLSLPGLVRLLPRERRDLVATRSAEAWWRFEEPLPLALAALADLTEGAFYDVGANTGFYSVLLGRLHPTRTIRAFEPVPEIAACCVENLELAHCEADVEEIALAAEDGTATLHLPPADHGLIESSASLDPTFKEEIASSIVVRTERLDTANARLGAEPVGLVKIDVEGAEHLVLSGATATITRDRPVVAVELLPRAHLAEIDELVRDWGYAVLSLRPGLLVAVEDGPAFLEDSWNQLLVPRERLEEVLPALAAASAVAARLEAGLDGEAELAGLTTRERALRVQLGIEARLRHDVRRELDRRSTEVSEAHEGIANLLTELDELHQERDRLTAERDDARARVAELERSTSWRVTAPLRRASELAHRPRGGAGTGRGRG